MAIKFKSFFLTLGIFYILIGALGISNMGFFNQNIEYILSTVLFLNGIYHVFYSMTNRKSPYFHWGLVLGEGIIELISVAIILLNTFTSQLFFTSYIGGLLCLKGLILILGWLTFLYYTKSFPKIKVFFILLPVPRTTRVLPACWQGRPGRFRADSDASGRRLPASHRSPDPAECGL